MKKISEIEKFIKHTMDKYSIPYHRFYSYLDQNGESKERNVFPSGKVDEYNLNRISRILGLDKETILSCNQESADKWFNKYRFFYLMIKYRQTNYFADKGVDYAAGIIGQAIFGVEFDKQDFKKKFRREDVEKRLLATLKYYDDYVPGLYHPNGKIEKLEYSEEYFIQFDQIENLVEDFLTIVDRHKELFFKIWDSKLTEEEIREYNFLTTVLRAEDVAKAGGYLYHHKVVEMLPIFKSEGFKEYESYVHIRSGTDFEPWHCPRFADNFELAQRYNNIFPRTKKSIREFCMEIKNILCMYTWTDDELIVETDEDWVPNEFKLGSYHEFKQIFVPKTNYELGEDEKYAERLIRFAGSESKGGLKIPENPEPESQINFIQRLTTRVKAGIKKGEDD